LQRELEPSKEKQRSIVTKYLKTRKKTGEIQLLFVADSGMVTLSGLFLVVKSS